MRKAVHVVLVAVWCVVFAALPAAAKDLFYVAYRQVEVASDGKGGSGYLLVTVRNVSGAEARDISASIPDTNHVTYDNGPVFIGTLADGQRKEVMNRAGMPQEVVKSGDMDEQAIWLIEFTDVSGERKTAEVVGRKIQ